MHPDLKTRRRVFVFASQTYTLADNAWRKGLREAALLVPDVEGHGYWKIGNPGSRMRRLYDQRDQALQRMTVARLKLQVAKTRRHCQRKILFACCGVDPPNLIQKNREISMVGKSHFRVRGSKYISSDSAVWRVVQVCSECAHP